MINPFEQLAERQMNGAQRAKERRDARTAERKAQREAAPMVPSPLERKMLEKAELMKNYRAWRRSVRDEIRASHGREVAELLRLLRKLSWSNAPLVVSYVQNARWLSGTDNETRLYTLDMIENSFARARVRAGLSVIDDGLWDEPPGPFIQIRDMLGATI